MKYPLIYIHVPKTAGRTFEYIIENYFSINDLFKIYGQLLKYSFQEIINVKKKMNPNPRIYMGHIFFGLHNYIDKSAKYFAFLRDPVQRTVSHYNYVRKNHELQGTARKMSLYEYVEKDPTMEMNNGQTIHIAGLGNGLSSFDYLRSCDFKKEQLKGIDGLLEIAKNNIEKHFCMIGITERFDETIMILRKIMGKKGFYYIKRNVYGKKPTTYRVDSKTEQLIRERNELDIELYEYAKVNLDKRVAEYGSSFRKELKKYQREQKIHNYFYNVNRIISYCERIFLRES